MASNIFARLAVLGLLAVGLTQPLAAVAVVTVDTESLRLQFGKQGDLLRVESCFPACGSSGGHMRVLSGAEGMRVCARENAAELQLDREREDGATVLTFADKNGRLARRWRIPDQGWMLSVAWVGAGQATLMSGEDFRPAPASGFAYLLEQSRYLFFTGSDVDMLGLDEPQQVTRDVSGWFGFRNRFWTAMILPGATLAVNVVTGEAVEDARVSVQLDSESRQRMDLFAGTVER